MALVKDLTRSFAGGEITPEMYGRLDNVKYQTGLALCRNALILPHGPAAKRPGTAYVNKGGNSAYAVRIIPFQFSASQSMVLEFGHLYIRFHTSGATLSAGSPAAYNGATAYNLGDLVSSGGVNYYCIASTTGNAPPNATYWYAMPASGVYEIPSPYSASDLFDLDYTQSADVVTLSHPSYATRELRRLGATNWQLTAPSLGTTITAPTIGSGTATAGTGTAYNRNFYYKVTTVTPDGLEESLPSASYLLTNDLTLQGAKNVINWSATVSGSPTYRVYKAVNNSGRLYGYIGETSDLTFTDDNITPDYSRNPPAQTLRLDTSGNYPAAVGYYEQRRMFAGTLNNPQTIYGSRSGTESNFNTSMPSNASDALSFKIKAQQQNAVKHLVPLNDLLALTVGGIWKISSTNNQALSPTTLSARQQNSYGSNSVHPLLTGISCLYVEANSRRVRDLSYVWQSQVYQSDDRSIMAPHLFTNYSIVDAAYSRSPDQIAWFVRSDGVLLGLSYVPEHQVFAWHQHVTDGYIESVCVVTENSEDILYLVVRRTLNGATTRVIERMASRRFLTQADAYFVDCGATYSGAPATTISGLSWLEGKSVVALADGAVVNNLTVTSGQITLPTAASKVQVGLPYTADLQTLPLAIDGAMAEGQGINKAIDYAYLRVQRTGIIYAGPDASSLVAYPPRTTETYDAPPNLISDVIDILIQPTISQDAQLWVRSQDPTPLTLSAITMKVSFGN